MPITTLDDITVANVKSYYNYTDTNRDTQIALVMPMVRDMIYGFCNSDFQSKSRTERPVVNDSTTKDIFLKYRPVTSITSVVEDSVTLVSDQDYFCELDTGRLEKIQSNDAVYIYNKGPYWSDTRNGIVVTYVAGQTLTQDVILAFFEIVGLYCDINQKVVTDIEGNEHAVSIDTIPKDIKDILNRYIQTYHI